MRRMKQLTAACIGAFLFASGSQKSTVDAFISHSGNRSIARDDLLFSSPSSMLEVQWGEDYKFIDPQKTANGFEFVFVSITGPFETINPGPHAHCAAVGKSFDSKTSKQFSKKTDVHSIEDCQNECHADADCKGAVYEPEDLSCRMFNNLKGINDQEDAVLILPTCNGSCFHQNHKLSGSSVLLGSAPNAHICQALCQSDSSCFSFSFNKSTKQCFRHSNGAELVEDSNFTSGGKEGCNGQPSESAAGGCIHGNNSSSADYFSMYPYLATVDNCRYQCTYDKRCSFFTYETSSKKCLLKRSRGNLTHQNRHQTGSRYCDASCFTKNVLLKNDKHLLKTLKERWNPYECHSDCYEHSQCRKWSFNPDTRTCYLFSSESNAKKVLLQNAWTGGQSACYHDSMLQFGSPDCARLGFKFGTSSYYNTSSGDATSCQRECFNDLNCEAFSYDTSKRMCYFHLAVAVRHQVQNSHYISGPKKCAECHKVSQNKSGNYYYYSGEQIDEIDDVETPEECQLHCQATGDCAYWSHIADSKECTLYDSHSIRTEIKNKTNAVVTTGPKYCEGACDLKGFEADTTDFGYLKQVGKKSLGDCRKECEEDTNCENFVYVNNYSCTLTDGSNLRNLKSTSNKNKVIGFPVCSPCMRQGVGYKAEKKATLYNVVAHSGRECQHWCELSEFCTRFSFNIKTKKCLLLSGATEEEDGEEFVSGAAPCEQDSSCIMKNMTMNESDTIKEMTLPSVYDCQEKCARDIECRFFSFNNIRKICILKGDGGNDTLRAEARNGHYSGTKKCLKQTEEKSLCTSHDYSELGDDLDDKPQKLNNAKECRRSCAFEPRCRHWVFNQKTKECKKKTRKRRSRTIFHFIFDIDIVAGSRLGCPKCLRAGYTYKGDTIVVINKDNEVMCQQACEIMDDCEAFVFENGKCKLLEDVSEPIPAAAGVISGPKTC